MKRNLLPILLMVPTFIACTVEEFPFIKFHQTRETLLKLKEVIESREKGVYLRFGDGDVNLANGQIDMQQNPSEALKIELQAAFRIQGPNVLKALPIMCKEFDALEEGMYHLNHGVEYKVCLSFLRRTKPLWGDEFTDIYSPVAIHFAATQYPDLAIEFLKFLRKSPCYMLVGNKFIPKAVRDILFGENCIFVPTPPKQSYSAIDQIEQDCLPYLENSNEYKIIITSMGNAGRVLQKRLWEKFDNIFLFDFGSLMDAFCGWNTRAWIGLTRFDGPAFLRMLKEELKADGIC